jgi:hypothetical protein
VVFLHHFTAVLDDWDQPWSTALPPSGAAALEKAGAQAKHPKPFLFFSDRDQPSRRGRLRLSHFRW